MKSNEFAEEPPVAFRDREAGSTNFERCGWCIHCFGTHRFSYCIQGRCELQPSYSAEVTWKTCCQFKDISKHELTSIIAHKRHTIHDHKSAITLAKKQIAILQSIRKTATTLPPLPGNRCYDYYNVGDKVRVFVAQEGQEKWFAGSVELGYRHHDGCVSYRLDGFGPQEKGFWGCGTASPYILLEKEYKFFVKHQDKYLQWCAKAYRDRQADLRVALISPETKQQLCPLGYCPICHAPGVRREKRPKGNDKCANGHTYPSAQAKEK